MIFFMLREGKEITGGKVGLSGGFLYGDGGNFGGNFFDALKIDESGGSQLFFS